AAVAGRLGARLRALHTAWAHYRETRRKEKMRREVIRKHAREAADGNESLPRVRRVKAPAAPDDAEDGKDDPETFAEERPAGARPAQKPLPFAAEGPTELGEEEAKGPAPKPARRKREAGPVVAEAKTNSGLPPYAILDEMKITTTADNERLYERGRILQ